MKRRTFLQTAIGALMVPTFRLRDATVRHLDLSPFCGDSGRYDLDTPFFQEGMTYATDARIAIRTGLLPTPPDDSTECMRPKVASHSGWASRHEGWHDLRSARIVRDPRFSPECPTCFGWGRIGAGVVACAACGGEGYRCHYGADDDEEWGYETPCRACQESGWTGGMECHECGGRGTVEYAVQVAPGWLIAPAYRAKVLTLGDVQYAIPSAPKVVDGHPMDPIMLRFDGGDGLLMGMRNR